MRATATAVLAAGARSERRSGRPFTGPHRSRLAILNKGVVRPRMTAVTTMSITLKKLRYSATMAQQSLNCACQNRLDRWPSGTPRPAQLSLPAIGFARVLDELFAGQHLREILVKAAFGEGRHHIGRHLTLGHHGDLRLLAGRRKPMRR